MVVVVALAVLEESMIAPTPEDAVLLVNEVQLLRKALAEAMFNRSHVKETCVDYDPAGSTYDLEWMPHIKEWAALCNVDLEKYDPFFYSRH